MGLSIVGSIELLASEILHGITILKTSSYFFILLYSWWFSVCLFAQVRLPSVNNVRIGFILQRFLIKTRLGLCSDGRTADWAVQTKTKRDSTQVRRLSLSRVSEELYMRKWPFVGTFCLSSVLLQKNTDNKKSFLN